MLGAIRVDYIGTGPRLSEQGWKDTPRMSVQNGGHGVSSDSEYNFGLDTSTVGALRINRLLSLLSDDELSGFLGIGHWVTFEEDEIVSRQGEHVSDVLFIVEGRARAEVHSNGDSNLSAVVNFPRPGEDIGLLSLLDGAPHSSTVTAVEQIRALSIPLAALRMHLRSRVEWYRTLAEIAVERLRTSGLLLQGFL